MNLLLMNKMFKKNNPKKTLQTTTYAITNGSIYGYPFPQITINDSKLWHLGISHCPFAKYVLVFYIETVHGGQLKVLLPPTLSSYLFALFVETSSSILELYPKGLGIASTYPVHIRISLQYNLFVHKMLK